MTTEKLEQILKLGENIKVEFKRCGNGVENDTYETVCAFLNRFGGDIFLGVEDDGTVIGVPKNAARDMIKNFINIVSNPNAFSPATYIEPNVIEYKNKAVIHVHVNPSADVHSYKGTTYDRVGDADVKVVATDKTALMWIRKQNVFTERKVFKYVEMSDLRLDLLPMIRMCAKNTNGGAHHWEKLSDEEILKSAGFFGIDRTTGERGINLAGIMLLGKDYLIKDVTSGYCTDAILRVENVDRFDDRLLIETNLVESYQLLMDFTSKHLPDPFFLEGTQRISLRGILTREMISNLLIHRELTSAYPAKFVIERDRMYTQNANRATGLVEITLDDFEPIPKNPLIASFFRVIGYADTLGSGVRNLFKYARHYQHSRPEMIEQDIFQTTVYFRALDEIAAKNPTVNSTINGNPSVNEDSPLNPHINSTTNSTINSTINTNDSTINYAHYTLINTDKEIVKLISANPQITQSELAQQLFITRDGIAKRIKILAEQRIISRTGARKNGSWIVNIDINSINP